MGRGLGTGDCKQHEQHGQQSFDWYHPHLWYVPNGLLSCSCGRSWQDTGDDDGAREAVRLTRKGILSHQVNFRFAQSFAEVQVPLKNFSEVQVS